MRVALTGATGLVGFPIARALRDGGHEVVALGRTPVAGMTHLPFDLMGSPPPLEGIDALVHAAFSHVEGRYRGGEGEDAEGFVAANGTGSIRLFEAARRSGVARAIFLSSRAVYGSYPVGTRLTEDLTPRPDTLYGRVKHDTERALAGLSTPGFAPVSLRATGVCGPPVPGRPHKWASLFDAFARGEMLSPRIGTEVHADDLAAAVTLLLSVDAGLLAPGLFNLSDFVLDRHDLLAGWSEITGIAGPLPTRADPATVSAMPTDRLRALGWRPGRRDCLPEVLRALA